MIVKVKPIRPIYGVTSTPIRREVELDLNAIQIRKAMINGYVYSMDGTRITPATLQNFVESYENSTNEEKKEVMDETPVDENSETDADDQKEVEETESETSSNDTAVEETETVTTSKKNRKKSK